MGFKWVCATCGERGECKASYFDVVDEAQKHNFDEHRMFGAVGIVRCTVPGEPEPDTGPPDLPEGHPDYAPEPSIKRETMHYMQIDEIKRCCDRKGLVPAQVPGINFYQFMYKSKVGKVDHRGRYLQEISWKDFEKALISKGIGVWGRKCFMKIRKI